MSRRTDAPPLDEPSASDRRAVVGDTPDGPASVPAGPDLSALPIAGLTRRRVGAILAALIAAWIILMFARQVSEATAASTRADALVATNADARGQVSALERERDLIVRQRFIEQQARAYRLGGAREIAFTLDPDAPALADDAPGSASVSLGARRTAVEPLERWLTVLFGPSD